MIKLKDVTAMITDVQYNRESQIAIVGVEIAYEGDKWKKAFRIKPNDDGVVAFKTFKERLAQQVKKDFDVDKALGELKEMENEPFTLDEKTF